MPSIFQTPAWIRQAAAALLIGLTLQAQATDAALAQGCTPDQRAGAIHTQGFLRIEGIDQWVTIDGARCDDPVILMVHGGSGNPNTPHA